MTSPILASYFHTLDPYAVQFGGSFGIRWYGLSYLAGFLAGYYIILWMTRRGTTQLKPEQTGDFVFAVAFGTIIGGRLGYCLLYSPELLWRFTAAAPFWGVLAIYEGGMASHGGILGILFTCLLYAWRHRISGFHLADLTTLGGAIGIFFGRLANFVNGELVGRPVQGHLPWGVKFPQDIFLWPTYEPERLESLGAAAEAVGTSSERWTSALRNMRFSGESWNFVEQTVNSIVQAVQSGNRAAVAALEPVLTERHPSQLYEALLEGLALLATMILLWRSPRKPGFITGAFFIAYSTARILGEQFRMPDAHIGFQLLGLTRGQWLSFGLLGLGCIIIIWAMRRDAPRLGGWGDHSKASST